MTLTLFRKYLLVKPNELSVDVVVILLPIQLAHQSTVKSKLWSERLT